MVSLAAYAMAIIVHSTLCTSDRPLEWSLWILQVFSRSLANANANNKKGIVKKFWLLMGDFVVSLAWVLHLHFCSG